MLRLKKSESVGGIEIRGGADFQRRTREAIALLRSLGAFELVRTHLAIIRQGKRSGVQAWARNPIFTVGTPTWNHSALWYAGAIAHDAFHAKLIATPRSAIRQESRAPMRGAARRRKEPV